MMLIFFLYRAPDLIKYFLNKLFTKYKYGSKIGLLVPVHKKHPENTSSFPLTAIVKFFTFLMFHILLLETLQKKISLKPL